VEKSEFGLNVICPELRAFAKNLNPAVPFQATLKSVFQKLIYSKM